MFIRKRKRFLYFLQPTQTVGRFLQPTQGSVVIVTEKHSLRVGWRNLPTLRVGWRNIFSSCAVVSVFGSGGTLASRGLEEPAHASRGLFLINTFLLYTSLSPYSQTDGRTDGQTDRQRNEYTCFAWAGGTYPRFAWAGGTLSVFCSGGE